MHNKHSRVLAISESFFEILIRVSSSQDPSRVMKAAFDGTGPASNKRRMAKWQ